MDCTLVSTVLYVLSGLVIGWALVSYFFVGDRFMRWYYRQWGRNEQDFDARKSRMAHAVTLFLTGVSGLFIASYGIKWFLTVTMLVFFLFNLVLIMTWSKKKGSAK